jgi:Subtilase family
MRVGQVSKGRPHPCRSAIAITAAVIVSVTALPAAAVSASAQVSTSPIAASPVAGSGTAAKAEPLLLINGDLLSVRPAGRTLIASLTARPDHDPLWTLSTGSATYEFPVDAIPYLGHGLDASLFNVTLLRRLESGGRLPVRVSYAGAVPSVPGITITSSGDGLAAGYLTAASAATFGRALDHEFAAGHASGYYGGLFGGVNIALAGASIAAPVRPQFPMRTLTVTATNEWGKPDSSDEIMVLNADDLETFGDPYESVNVFSHGSAKFSVPVGHYWALTNFMRLRGDTVLSQRIVVLPQFTVSGNGTTVHVAASAASSQVTFSTPRPATIASTALMISRTGRLGPPVLAIFVPFSTPLWVSPTKTRPSVGSLTSYTQAQLFSPAKMKGTPYEYTLDFSGPPGIVPAQHFTATPANLATIHEKIYDNANSTAMVKTFGGSLAQISEPIFIENLFTTAVVTAPGEQTEYISGGPSYIWLTSVSLGDTSLLDNFHTLPDGRSFTESWNQYPLHPQPDVNLLTGPAADSYPDTPMAYRIGNEIWFDPIPFSDNDSQFGHINGTNYPGTYRIVDNGHQVAGGGFIGDGEAAVPPTASTVSFSLRSVQGPDPQSTLSQRTYTVWTTRTAAQPAAKVPPSWECSTTWSETRHCAVPSMLTLDYHVRHLGLDGVTPAGPQQISVSVGHIQLSKPSAIVSAKAQVSWDNGLSWHPAAVTRTSAGNYLVSFTPPPAVDVTLSFTARDAAGGSVSETITNAYAVGPSAPSGTAPGTTTAHTTRAGGFLGDGFRMACPSARAGYMQCFALYRPQTAVNRAIAAGETGQVSRPVGLTPKEIEQAYRLPVGRLSDQTVAVSIAYNTPHLAEYLAKYRQTFGLPPCTTASGCFRVVNQYGSRSQKKLPVSGVGSGWDIEVTLDVSMISVACPHCKILVVEANNDSISNLARTEDTAAALGADVISNSYGIRENGDSIESAKSYDHPGHTIVVAAGDLGFTATEFPADLSTVTAVGGTELVRAHTARGWREQVWYDPALQAAGGSGCSAYVAKPAWQHDPDCLGRTVADVSAVAANIPIYNQANGGWLTVGGTSVAAPLVAGIYALAGNATIIPFGYAYSHRRFLFDITKGTNSVFYPSKLTCGNDYLCVAKKGYDAPTGLGTPDGTGAF